MNDNIIKEISESLNIKESGIRAVVCTSPNLSSIVISSCYLLSTVIYDYHQKKYKAGSRPLTGIICYQQLLY